MLGTAGPGRSALALQIIEGAEDAVFALDEQFRLILANPAAERLFGAAEAELQGRSAWGALPAGVGMPLESACRRAMAERAAVEVEPFSGPAQRTYAVRIGPLAGGGLNICFHDVTDRHRAQPRLGHDEEQSLTGRRQAEDALRRANEDAQRHRAQLETILDSLTEGLVVSDLEGNLLHWNPAAVTMHGFSSLEECRRRFPEFATDFELADADGNVLPVDQWPLARILRGEHLRNLEIRIRRLQDDWKRVFTYGGSLVRDPHGQQFLAVVTVSDISERKRAEEALRNSHQLLEAGVRERTVELNKVAEALDAERRRFQDVLDILPAYVVLLTPDYHVRFANRFFEERFGKSGGKRCFEYLFHRTEPCEICETYSVLKTMAPHRWEWTGPDGRNYDIYDFPFTDADGSTMILEMGLDITQRKHMEEEVRRASLYARSLIEASLDPLVTISPEGKITDVNQATVLVTGVARERLVGSDFSDYFTEPDWARAGYQKVLADGLVRDYPLTIRHAEGHTTDVLYNAVVYRNEAGQVQGVFAAARDITERKRAEAELARYRDHLEELVQQRTSELESANADLQRTTAELARSNQELEQFAYVASHDLQEPLRAVTGYVGLIEQQLGDQLDDEGRRHIAGAVQGAARMHTLISDLLALSRVGTQGQVFAPADLNAVLDEALQSLGASVMESGAKITRDPLPTLSVDARQMTQLFQNLIGNALKFRGVQPPEIHISAQAQADQWVLAVRDNGIGIERQYFERIFLVFQRLHTRKQYPGTGIGLAICKKIVERHGGTIRVESQAGRGSTFRFTLPTRETQ